MKKKQNNYAFIDGQNLNLGIREIGWKLDFKRFRIYLEEKYSVKKAYYFIGYIKENENLYKDLERWGFVLMYKPIVPDERGKPKGNVDADIVFRALLDYRKYSKAVVVSSDGDFYRLIDHLYRKNKLEILLSPNYEKCSSLLKLTAREKIDFMNGLKNKLEYREKKKHR